MAVQKFQTRCLSSLSKVFPDGQLIDSPIQTGSALWNETYAFQIAYRMEGTHAANITVELQSELSGSISMRSVGLVPSEFPIYGDHDDDVLRATPGLYPDPLYDIKNGVVKAFPYQWRSVWLTVDLDDRIEAGVYSIEVVFKTGDGKKLAEEQFELEVIPVELPEQELIHTQWFHLDCLADQYRVPIFSEAHWGRIEQYVQTAVNHGINMILTPLFTPPLDTEVGSERPTVQLVDVHKTDGEYHFSFDKLTRWIKLCRKHNVQYFELSHLFTQWGAHHAPKIVATVDGEEKKIFGWDTDATGEDYKRFLSCFLPVLIAYIKEHDLEKNVYFHVSDEPTIRHLESYESAHDIIHHYLGEFPIIDALSDYAFYEKGLVEKPIPATNHIEPFLEHQVPDLWTYYCCSQYKDVSNRFFSFPSARNRMIGMQLYKYDIKGFLQWGYNFWFSQLSRQSIDPFKNTDAGHGFPSGDAFIIYPGEEGPIESLRMEVFYEALQDMRALQLLGRLIGKERVISILEQGLDTALTFKAYPIDINWLLEKRDEINRMIARNYTAS